MKICVKVRVFNFPVFPQRVLWLSYAPSKFSKEKKLVMATPPKPPGSVAQSVGHLIRKLQVLGSIPGLATYFRISFR